MAIVAATIGGDSRPTCLIEQPTGIVAAMIACSDQALWLLQNSCRLPLSAANQTHITKNVNLHLLFRKKITEVRRMVGEHFL